MNLNFLKNLLLKGKLIVQGSFEQGNSVAATGPFSHAQGVSAVAIGQASYAAGYKATAAQNYTYAWSDGNLGTTTQNISTTRSGQYMVSASGGMFIPGNVGIGTNNNSNALTVVGNISGNNLKVSFNQGLATKDYSFAEGSGKALNRYAHAEGEKTIAAGQWTHAEGNFTRTGKSYPYETYTNATRVFTFTSENENILFEVFPGDTLSGFDNDVSAEQFTIIVLDLDTITRRLTAVNAVIGADSYSGTLISSYTWYSHAEGYGTEASGDSSHAEGNNTVASGDASHAEGEGTVASSTASHAEGYNTKATRFASHAEGDTSEARGITSHAAGFLAIADHDYTYVWADGEVGTNLNTTITTKPGQYLIDASGGVYIPRTLGIGTDSTNNALTVVGTISTYEHRSSVEWNDAYNISTTLASISGTLAKGDYLPLSGGTVTGDVGIKNAISLSSITFTGNTFTSVSGITASDIFVEIKVNNATKYIRLFDIN